MRKFYTLSLLLVLALTVKAQKTFIPPSWSYNSSTGVYRQADGLEMYKHSLSSQHFDVYYGVGYGTTPPEKLASSNALYVNVPDLLDKAEMFFDTYVNKLKFADLATKSKLNTYKMIIVLLYDTGWTATGSGYDNSIGALWVTPSTCHPVGQTIAHEIGHAFQYQVYCDLGGYAGFRDAIGSGSTFWEQTAQWQSVEVYPDLMISQSIGVWKNSHNYAFTHEWQRYQSYWLHYYWVDKYGIDAVGRVWRGGKQAGQDPNQVYMSVFNVSVDDLFKEYFDYACKMVTYDIDEIRNYGKGSIGQYTYNCVDLGGGEVQVAYSSCPQSTGFNVIPLEVPAAGTKIKTVFTALAPGCALAKGDPGEYLDGNSVYSKAGVTNYNTFSDKSKRGFRHGYVALLNDGTRVYESVDTVYARGTVTKADSTYFVVPEGTQQLWFVVSPAPKSYIVHKWDDNIKNDDQWPYRVRFEHTSVKGLIPYIDLSDPTILPKDTIINAYIGLEPSTGGVYGSVPYQLGTGELRAIGEALRLQPGDVNGLMKTWSSSQSNNSIFLLPLNPSTLSTVNKGSTANGYGHWFSNSGTCVSWGTSSYVYSEFDPATLTFTVGQYPDKCKKGNSFTFGQALQYKNGEGKIGRAKIIFHVFIGGIPAGIEEVVAEKPTNPINGIFDLSGRRYPSKDNLPRGLYIIDGKKYLVR